MGYYISCPRFVIDDVSCLSDCGLVHEELLPDENDSSDKTSFNLPSAVGTYSPRLRFLEGCLEVVYAYREIPKGS